MTATRAASLICVAIGIVACRRNAAPPVAELPPLPSPQLSVPVLTPLSAAQLMAARDTARETRVDIDTHGHDEDVRPLLDYVARQGGFTLVFSPGITKKVRVQLTDVPVSVALQTLLSLAGLTIESSTPEARVPGSTSVVFYELPMNVDSLSVEAIMKRFGVGRSIAELIVQSRTKKP
jgi:hypothetical protein